MPPVIGTMCWLDRPSRDAGLRRGESPRQFKVLDIGVCVDTGPGGALEAEDRYDDETPATFGAFVLIETLKRRRGTTTKEV